MNILVSRCLLGIPCRYDGKEKHNKAVEQLQKAGHTLIAVCPESDGGLPTPRPPAEVRADRRVVNCEGIDVTAEYVKGAELALQTAERYGCTAAVLKARSPSCGSTEIYDGSFRKKLIPGRGIAAELLTEAGIRVVDEDHIANLFPVNE